VRGSGDFDVRKTFDSCAICKFGHINVASVSFMMVAETVRNIKMDLLGVKCVFLHLHNSYS